MALFWMLPVPHLQKISRLQNAAEDGRRTAVSTRTVKVKVLQFRVTPSKIWHAKHGELEKMSPVRMFFFNIHVQIKGCIRWSNNNYMLRDMCDTWCRCQYILPLTEIYSHVFSRLYQATLFVFILRWVYYFVGHLLIPWMFQSIRIQILLRQTMYTLALQTTETIWFPGCIKCHMSKSLTMWVPE